MKLPDILGILGGLDAPALFNAVLHYVTPKVAKPGLVLAINQASLEQKRKWGRLFKMAGEKLDRADPDEEGAAGDLARGLGEIRLF